MPSSGEASSLFSYIYKWVSDNCRIRLPEKRASCLNLLCLGPRDCVSDESVTSRNASQSEYRRRYPDGVGLTAKPCAIFVREWKWIRTH